MKTNVYPVNFKDFLKIKTPGNYILTYALLDDRIHLEMNVENCIYSTQRFYTSISEEIKEKSANYTGSQLKIFLDGYFNNITTYRYYPNEGEITKIKSVKLYSKLKVILSKKIDLNTPLIITEYDDRIESTNTEGDKILIIKKEI